MVLNAPTGYTEELAQLLKGIEITAQPGSMTQAILAFVNTLAEAAKLAPEAIRAIDETGLLWIAYPKGGSGVKTDVNRDKLWPIAESFGWRPVRLIAIDEVWSAMRFRPEKLVKPAQ